MTMQKILMACAFATVTSAGPAFAHPRIEPSEAAIGSSYRAVIRIPHGCEGSATTGVRVLIPEGLIAVKPMPKPGWTIETKRGPYADAHPYYHGAVLKEGVREIAWRGRLADDNVDEFIFFGMVAKTLQAGTAMPFPVYQDCERGQSAWVEVAAAGQSTHDLKLPAPVLQLVQGKASGHHHGGAPATAPSYKVGGLVIEGVWSRETPGGARVAAGYLKITNTGKEADRLVGGTISVAKSVEVHEMTMVDNVMRMRRLEKGLEIKPGETVELKPSGHHLMFIDLSAPVKAGANLKGTLVFERAGEVAVDFKVNAMGVPSSRDSSGGKSGGHKHHH